MSHSAAHQENRRMRARDKEAIMRRQKYGVGARSPYGSRWAKRRSRLQRMWRD